MSAHDHGQSEVILVISSDEATALAEMGSALESFIVAGSPFDTATAKADEQAAQQMRGFDRLVDAAWDELGDRLYDVPPETLPDLRSVAEALVRRVLGVYQ